VKDTKSKIKGFAVSMLLGFLCMALTSYAIVELQSKEISNTVIGKSSDLSVFPINIDWGSLAVYESVEKNVTVANVGNDACYVYWFTDLNDAVAPSGYELTAASWREGKEYAVRLGINERLTVTFTLLRLGSSDANRKNFKIYFVSVVL